MDLQTELHQRLSEIGSHVDLAAAAAGSAHDAPDGLRSALQRLHELALQAKQRYMNSGREDELAGRLPALEAAADEACALCREQPAGHELPAATLDEARLEIRDLRRQVETGVR